MRKLGAVLLFSSANHDERNWENPDTFDITRDASRHLGFGYGVHSCVGQSLARLESEAVLRALLARVDRFEVGEPVRGLNNLIRAFKSLPVTVRPLERIAIVEHT